MRVPRRLAAVERLERATRPGRPTVVATPLAGAVSGGALNGRLITVAALASYTRSKNVLTANANGALGMIDGVAPAVSDLILLNKGAAGADNGLYEVTSLGSVGTKWSMERSLGMAADAECVPGMLITVAEGSENADSVWQLTTNGPITLNSTALAFSFANAKRLAWSGESSAEWPGASTTTTTKKVVHQLPFTPKAVHVFRKGEGPLGGSAFNITPTEFSFQMATIDGSKPGAGTKVEVTWIAVP